MNHFVSTEEQVGSLNQNSSWDLGTPCSSPTRTHLWVKSKVYFCVPKTEYRRQCWWISKVRRKYFLQSAIWHLGCWGQYGTLALSDLQILSDTHTWHNDTVKSSDIIRYPHLTLSDTHTWSCLLLIIRGRTRQHIVARYVMSRRRYQSWVSNNSLQPVTPTPL